MTSIDTLYNASCINWIGESSDGPLYSEIISEILLNIGIKKLMAELIKPIKRECYKIQSHTGKTLASTNRKEEILAKDLFGKEFEGIGTIIDYQIPLKGKQTDKVGKIDLISYKIDPEAAYIIELKHGLNKETLLRTVLEITTYYYLLSHDNFLRSYSEFNNLRADQIKKAVLIPEGGRQHKEILNLKERPNTMKLLRELDVEVLLISENLSIRRAIF